MENLAVFLERSVTCVETVCLLLRADGTVFVHVKERVLSVVWLVSWLGFCCCFGFFYLFACIFERVLSLIHPFLRFWNYMCVHISTRVRVRCADSTLKVKLQAVASHLAGYLRTKLRSIAKIKCVLLTAEPYFSIHQDKHSLLEENIIHNIEHLQNPLWVSQVPSSYHHTRFPSRIGKTSKTDLLQATWILGDTIFYIPKLTLKKYDFWYLPF